MSDEKIDVLVAMDRLLGNTRTMAGLSGDPHVREALREGEKARAAVEELIERADYLCRTGEGMIAFRGALARVRSS